ncbi:MAG: TRAP transporter large permease subunit, partial [Deltaproteobacteria bacterium]|nr:TRAP transporter large permease subunit [Deltaproteobacteria bacterium]
FIGVATPTEAAALGALSTALVAAMYRSLTFKVVAQSVMSTVRVSVVVLMIILASNAFSQVLAFTGASRGLVEMVAGFQAPPVVILVLMMLIVLVLGMFVDQISIMMITVPIYFPLAAQLGFDPIWFGILMLLNMEVANTTPPFGLQLFVLKGVVPDASMVEIYKSCFPFVLLDMVNLAVMIAFPALVLTLPRLMLS